jgi:hypothetical protein
VSDSRGSWIDPFVVAVGVLVVAGVGFVVGRAVPPAAAPPAAAGAPGERPCGSAVAGSAGSASVDAVLPAPTGDCPELAVYDPELASRSTAELEATARAGLPLPPSMVEEYFDRVRASTSIYRPEKRDCMYRVALLGLAGSGTSLRAEPQLFGLDRSSDQLAHMFVELPLRRELSRAQRDDLLAQIEEYFLSSLQARDDADRDFWRREYYGLLLVCELADAEREQLGAKRPDECLELQPREPPQPYRRLPPLETPAP